MPPPPLPPQRGMGVLSFLTRRAGWQCFLLSSSPPNRVLGATETRRVTGEPPVTTQPCHLCPCLQVGGVATGQDCFELILCGAVAVQTATTYWLEGAECFDRLAAELEALMKRKGTPGTCLLGDKDRVRAPSYSPQNWPEGPLPTNHLPAFAVLPSSVPMPIPSPNGASRQAINRSIPSTGAGWDCSKCASAAAVQSAGL